MKEILIFAGTTEGRILSEYLAAAGIRHTVCVATEYGEITMKGHPLLTVRRGRMDAAEMAEFIRRGAFDAVVDATHPYAKVVTENIHSAVEGMEIPYLRLARECGESWNGKENTHRIRYFGSHEECEQALRQTEGNILLTTGSKDLGTYCVSDEIKERLFVRVLPGIESIGLCLEHGIRGKQILALQGPFSAEMNEAMIRQYGIACLVTKMSGTAGGYREKLMAAERARIPVYVVGREESEEGFSLREVCEKLEIICGCGRNLCPSERMEIILAGIGMGNDALLTGEVQDAIRHADILLGAERMIAPYPARVDKRAYYRKEEILPYLRELEEKYTGMGPMKVVVLFSGDSGFYSGCQALYRALTKETEFGTLHAGVRIMPGISSVSYLASCIGESYHDAEILSIHGREVPDLAARIAWNEKTFLLMSGAKGVNALGQKLLSGGLTDCEIALGYQLSYPEQQIRTLSPEECLDVTDDGLYTCLVKNPAVRKRRITHGTNDSVFIRDKVPMTKEEVREVSICKLHLHEDSIVYDVGSGTGSIAVEIAALSDRIHVYALERKLEAVSLIRQNVEKFGLHNVSVVEAAAPEGISALPAPTHAFIGGSGGKMKEILSALYEKNPSMRIVINAISMETICEIKEVLAQFPVEREEVVQMQVSRAKKAGPYHLMQAENPVWICAFHFVQTKPQCSEE